MAGARSLRVTLARAFRLRCAACGVGRVFRRRFLRAERCSHCGWRFERGVGHWVGGSELHMFASFGLSSLLILPLLLLLGFTPAAMGAAIAASALLSLAGMRYSRSLFLALDFHIDPARDPDDRDPPGPVPAPFPLRPASGARRKRALTPARRGA